MKIWRLIGFFVNVFLYGFFEEFDNLFNSALILKTIDRNFKVDLLETTKERKSMEIDYEKAIDWNKKRKQTKSKEVVYYEFAPVICALVEIKWTHRDILGFLHESVLSELLPSQRITSNKTLSAYRLGWEKAEMVDAEEVQTHIKKFREAFGDTEMPAKKSAYRPSAISITGEMHTVIDFMKALDKNKIDTANLRDEIKAFYNENKNQNLDGLVLDYITRTDKNNDRVGG